MGSWGCISRRKRNLIPYFNEKHVICPVYWTDDVLLCLKKEKGVDKTHVLGDTLFSGLFF